MTSLGILSGLPVRLGLGLLRLTTEGRPSESEAIRVIHAALDHGIRLLDTADAYCLGDAERHYGERLARTALHDWSGPRDEVRIVTKIGMSRPKGKWVPSGSAKHLKKVIEGSLKALETERIFLLQLHVRDPRVPFEESLSALAELQKAGKVAHIGLCNVSPSEVRQAMRHFQVASVQNELSVLARSSAEEGMIELTRQLQIPFLAHRPLGGYAKVDKLDKNRVLTPIAERHKTTPRAIALAALLQSASHVIPLVGATRTESIESAIEASRLELTQQDNDALQAKYHFNASEESLAAIAPRVIPADLPQLEPNQGPGSSDEVVLIIGIQGAGKTSLVESYLQHGYVRLNRDVAGDKLDDLLPMLDQQLANGQRRIVLDNTYPTRVSRAMIVTIAHRYHVPVRCRYLATPIHEARFNVAMRMLERYDRLLGPDDFKQLAKSDPNLPPPAALQRWQDSFEEPEADEGFSAIDVIPFMRKYPSSWTGKGLMLDVDGTLRRTKSGELYPTTPDDIELLPNRKLVLEQWMHRGYQLFFVSNQSGVSSGKLSIEMTQACFDRTIQLLDLPVTEVSFCPHPAFPVGCFCRKPLPGQAVYLMRKHQLAAEHLVMVGDLGSDEQFANQVGAKFYSAAEFFGDDAKSN